VQPHGALQIEDTETIRADQAHPVTANEIEQGVLEQTADRATLCKPGRKDHNGANTGLATGLLTTAGDLLFAGDVSGNFIAFDPAKGAPLWHTQLGQVPSNAAQTYTIDGKQHVLVAAGDTLFAFTLY